MGGFSLEKEALAPGPLLCLPSPCGQIRPGDNAKPAPEGRLVFYPELFSALRGHSQRKRDLP